MADSGPSFFGSSNPQIAGGGLSAHPDCTDPPTRNLAGDQQLCVIPIGFKSAFGWDPRSADILEIPSASPGPVCSYFRMDNSVDFFFTICVLLMAPAPFDGH
ncbi:hypothetical protein chiPu_0027620 [Chiloscyllium punctatum]|uniref:Uncharacterized protein n=1 Tax=Chiloscyllium punctatum TaxID=137246 RepID=A0A401TKT6_CHIPU|nr:hypothetical protein [Chiloscyllium punctatum]